eukprot:COSAG01_NODE_37664_length_500_cov_1.326683_1_plen_108_part_01
MRGLTCAAAGAWPRARSLLGTALLHQPQFRASPFAPAVQNLTMTPRRGALLVCVAASLASSTYGVPANSRRSRKQSTGMCASNLAARVSRVEDLCCPASTGGGGHRRL